MAITHTQTITLMEVLRSSSDDVVENIKVVTTSVDDSDPAKYRAEKHDRFHISTDGISASTSGFKPYANLTESEVRGWISSELASVGAKTKEENEKTINQLIKFDNPIAVDKEVPW